MLITFIHLLVLLICILGFSGLLKNVLCNQNKLIITNIDFIYGYSFLIFISILLNFFIPLSKSLVFFLIIGIASFSYFLYKKNYKLNFLKLSLISFFLIFIAHGQGIAYDSQLYHLQTIQLISNFKIIFGIGNLQPHYGMNSSWHNFLSLINNTYTQVNLIYLGNISLFCFFINEIFKKNFNLNKNLSNIFLTLSIVYIFLYSFFHPYNNGTILNNLGSPEVDTVSMIFFILSIYLFMKCYEKKSIENFYLFSLSIFLVITIKLSYVGVFGFYLYIIYDTYYNREYLINKINIFIFISSFLWFLKSFILTGCAIFPFKLSCINSNWSMSITDVDNYSKIIQSFARDTPLRHRFTDFDFTLNSSQWFLPWLKEYFMVTEFLTISFLIIIISTLAILVIRLNDKKDNINDIKNYQIVLIAILFLNLMIWMRAPEIRFGYGSIISLTILLVSIIFKKIFSEKLIKYYFLPVLLMAFLPIFLKNKDNFENFTNNSFVRNFNYSNFKVIYETNNYKVFKPNDVFCNAFEGFCTYQGFKVSINKKYNYFFIKKD